MTLIETGICTLAGIVLAAIFVGALKLRAWILEKRVGFRLEFTDGTHFDLPKDEQGRAGALYLELYRYGPVPQAKA